MRLPNYKRWDKLEVEWEDALVADGGYDPDKYIKDFVPCIRRTLGYYIGRRKTVLFIAETDDRASGTFNGSPQDSERINAIPFGMIRKITKLTQWSKEVG